MAKRSRPPRPRFVELSWFSSRLEAEAVGHALDPYEIPFLVQSHDVGMFGPGMTGWSPGGASLRVPEDRLEEARELLSCVAPLADDQEPPEPSEGTDSR